MGVAGLATLAVVAGCGGSSNGRVSAPTLQRVPSTSLHPNGPALSRALPRNWQVTMQVWFADSKSILRVGLGSADVQIFDGPDAWHHVRLNRNGAVVDGQRTGASSLDASTVTLRALRGRVDIRMLTITGSKQ